MQTHDPKLQLDSDIPVILVKRRDLFKQTISGVLANHYQEWTEYTNKDGTFVADKNIFANKYIWNIRWFEAFNHYTTYKSKTEIFFEDILQNLLLINHAANLPHQEIELKSEKSPYGLDRIENLSEIKEFFNQLENDKKIHDCPIEQIPMDFK